MASFSQVFSAMAIFRILHCHITITCQPSFFKAFVVFLSLSLFKVIFSFQKWLLVFGRDALLHPSCPCQKQPFIKTTTPYFGNTISGFPGRRLSFFLNRNPWAKRNLLTNTSGFVSLPVIFDIIRLRSLFEKISAKMFLYMFHYIPRLIETEFRRQCVADQQCKFAAWNVYRKLIPRREGLQ